MAKKNEPTEFPGEPVPALEHHAAAEDPQAPPADTRGRRIRLVAAVVVGALVIAGGSAAVTAVALKGGFETGGMGAMPGMGAPATPGASVAQGPTVNTAGFPTGGPGIFTDTCLRTKTAPNDPIMMPGMSGMSMQHDFFGNTSTSASTVTTQLVGGATSCSTEADASAYWTPVLFQNGKALAPKATLSTGGLPRAPSAACRPCPRVSP